MGKFLSSWEKLTLVSENAPKFKHFSFLHGISIFIRFGAMIPKSLCFSVEFVCWLAKNANHKIHTMEKQNF